MSKNPKTCQHEMMFQVNAQLLEDSNINYAEISGHCLKCKKKVVFRGNKFGVSPEEPMLSVGSEEAVLPFLFEGETYDGKSMGYSITSGKLS